MGQIPVRGVLLDRATVGDLTITHERYQPPCAVEISVDHRSKLLQFRETVIDTMVVLTVNGELEVECVLG